MRLVIATPLYPPESGGPATYAELLVRELPGQGIEPILVKFADVRGYPKLLRHFLYYRRVFRAAQTADAVLALDPVSTGLPAMHAAKKARKPFFVKVVGDYAWEQGVQRFGVTDSLDQFVQQKNVPYPVRVLRAVETKVARAASAVIVPSQYLAGIVASWGIHSTVIGNSVSVDHIGTVPDALAKLPRPLIVSVGRLVPWKGMEALITTVAKLRNEYPASLAIVGDGPLLSGLTKQAERLLPGASLLTGRLSHEDTLAVIRSADVFVLNSTYEGLSHLLIEALRLGKAIIATNAGGNSELIKHEMNGLLIKPEDENALTASLKRLMYDETLRQKLAAEAVVSGAAYTPENVARATAALLKASV